MWIFLALQLVALDPREAAHLHNAKVLTSEGKNGEAYFSRDGKRIIFQSIRAGSPYYQIYTMNADGSNQRRVSTGRGKCTCGFFHPSAPKLLFASTHLDPSAFVPGKSPPPPAEPPGRYRWDFDRAMDIFVGDLAGGHLRRLTSSEGYDAEAAFSPDGKQIVFTSQRDGDLEIYTMSQDGKSPKRLTRAPGYDGGPFFSPDGKRIVWRAFRPPNEKVGEIYLMNADGSGERRLTSLGAVSWAPFFHPDGKRMLFSSNVDGLKAGQHGNFELYLLRDDGTGLERVTFHDGFDGLPSFSADGKRVLFTSTRGGGESQVYIADWVD